MPSSGTPGEKLLRAISATDCEAVEAAILEGADSDYVDPGSGDSALERALEFGSPPIVRCLLHHGADPNRVGRVGTRPLHVAVGCSIDNAISEYDAGERDAVPDVASIEALISAGADPSLTDEWGETSIDLAKRLQHHRAALILESVEERKSGQDRE
jgi:ankyrin repeat protein